MRQGYAGLAKSAYRPDLEGCSDLADYLAAAENRLNFVRTINAKTLEPCMHESSKWTK
jgi:hypothetical protein